MPMNVWIVVLAGALIVSVGIGYRFNLCDLFGRCASEPLK